MRSWSYCLLKDISWWKYFFNAENAVTVAISERGQLMNCFFVVEMQSLTSISGCKHACDPTVTGCLNSCYCKMDTSVPQLASWNELSANCSNKSNGFSESVGCQWKGEEKGGKVLLWGMPSERLVTSEINDWLVTWLVILPRLMTV